MTSDRSAPRRVFLSYTGEDLAEHAAKAVRAIGDHKWAFDDHRRWDPSGRPALSECRRCVRESDALIVLVAHRYGTRPTVEQGGDGVKSFVQYEVEEAEAAGMPWVPLLVDEDAEWKRAHLDELHRPDDHALLAPFRDRLRLRTAGFFSDAKSVYELVRGALRKLEQQLDAASRASPAPAPPSDPLRDYLAIVERRHAQLQLLGFGDLRGVHLPIDRLYVPLGLSTGTAGEASVALEDVFRRAEERERRRGVVLLGDPGCGKTTALRRLAWHAAAADQGPERLGLAAGTVPILLPLRAVEPADLEGDLDAYVARRFATDTELERVREALYGHPRKLWLLDGLDEVRDRRTRERVLGWIGDSLRLRGGDAFAVTCRRAGWLGDSPLAQAFLPIQVLPLGKDERGDFVRKWFDAVEAEFARSPAEAHAAAAARSAALLEILEGENFTLYRHLATMAASPLLLSLFCLVHRRDADLPRRRGVLYEKCVEILIEHWGQRRGAALDASAVRSLLQALAWWLHQQREQEGAPLAECGAAIEERLAALSPHARPPGAAAEVLERMVEETSLLAMHDAGTVGFLHPTFREYLAAREAVDQRAAAALARNAGDEHWREVILLALSAVPPAFTREFFAAAGAGSVSLERRSFLVRVADEALHAPAGLVAELFADPGSRAQATEGDGPANPAGIDWVDVPAGEFDRGGTAHADEQPIVRCRVPAFRLARTPVTNAQFERFLAEAKPAWRPEYWEDSRFNGPNQPVVGVSWEQAQEFCQWAGLRLPSETEWEYACRAGSTTEYSSGDGEEALKRVGWCAANSEGRLHDVAEKPANALGLHDMHGNVWEWCQDRWHGSYQGAPSDGSAWEDGASGGRVIRGGSFEDPAWLARSAYRDGWSAGDRGGGVGFRPAL